MTAQCLEGRRGYELPHLSKWVVGGSARGVSCREPTPLSLCTYTLCKEGSKFFCCDQPCWSSISCPSAYFDLKASRKPQSEREGNLKAADVIEYT